MYDVLQFLSPLELSAARSTCLSIRDDVDLTARVVLERLVRSYPYLTPLIEKLDMRSPIRLLHELTRERLYIVGGGSVEQGQDSYKALDEFAGSGKGWVQRSPMTQCRGTFKTEACSFQGKLVTVCGDGNGSAGTLEAYCPLADKWTPLPDLPQPLSFVASASSTTALYVTGGMDKRDGSASANVSFLTGGGTQWQEGPPLPSARFGHASCVFRDELWVVGGHVDDCATASVSVLDVAPQQSRRGCCSWGLGPAGPMHRRRVWARLLVAGDCLWAVGGDVDDRGAQLLPTAECLRRDSRDGVWRWGQPVELAQHRRVFSAVALQGRVLVLGGRGETYETLTDCEALLCGGEESESARWETERDLELSHRESFIGGGASVVQACPLSW